MINIVFAIINQQDLMFYFLQWKKSLGHPFESNFVLLEPLVPQTGYVYLLLSNLFVLFLLQQVAVLMMYLSLGVFPSCLLPP